MDIGCSNKLLSIFDITTLRDAQQLQKAAARLWLAVLSLRRSSLLHVQIASHVPNQCMLTACQKAMHVVSQSTDPAEQQSMSTF